MTRATAICLGLLLSGCTITHQQCAGTRATIDMTREEEPQA